MLQISKLLGKIFILLHGLAVHVLESLKLLAHVCQLPHELWLRELPATFDIRSGRRQAIQPAVDLGPALRLHCCLSLQLVNTEANLGSLLLQALLQSRTLLSALRSGLPRLGSCGELARCSCRAIGGFSVLAFKTGDGLHRLLCSLRRVLPSASSRLKFERMQPLAQAILNMCFALPELRLQCAALSLGSIVRCRELLQLRRERNQPLLLFWRQSSQGLRSPFRLFCLHGSLTLADQHLHAVLPFAQFAQVAGVL
mmetsp:Transcript_34471/g.91012  ORF Transcript_34471/g.91012 Transcript_34471/m.91012 type:complete len:255 (-) Transcript_34471:663-1427(-)